jgi:hypothetical protein
MLSTTEVLGIMKHVASINLQGKGEKVMKVKCYCGKVFTEGLKLAQHRKRCREFQVKHYHKTASDKTVIPYARKPTTLAIMKAAMKLLGFRQTETENQPGVRRSWWAGPKYNKYLLADLLRTKNIKLDVYMYEIAGVGWSLSECDGFDPDSEWCLSIFKDNKWGRLEADGIDTTDLARWS